MASSSQSFAKFLADSRVKSMSQSFEDLLAREINIAPGIRSKDSDSQNHLRDFLGSERGRDASFPRILKDADFLGGSFARHTKTWPLDDIDIYVPLDGESLHYVRMGQRFPYTVLGDGILLANPLCGPRWMVGGYVSSAMLINGFVPVLKRHYPNSEVTANGECVSVRFTHGATTDEDGLGYDIVPCFSLQPDDANAYHIYLNAEREQWVDDHKSAIGRGNCRRAARVP